MIRKTCVALLFILLAGICLTGAGCEQKVDVEALKKAFFKQAIDLAILAIDQELGEKKEERVAWITSKIESWDTLGLLEYIPGWRDAIENAYDAVFRNIREKLQELYPETTAADAPAWQLLSSENFTEYYNFVMHPIE